MTPIRPLVSGTPDLNHARRLLTGGLQSANRVDETIAVLDYCEALIAALRDAREIVEKWAIVRHHMGDNYARERLLMDGIDALLPPEPQR